MLVGRSNTSSVSYHDLEGLKAPAKPAMANPIPMMRRMSAIHTFLFFHHIFLFTARAVLFKSYEVSAIVRVFSTRISILSPRSIALSRFFREICSASDSSLHKFFHYFWSRQNLSTFALSLKRAMRSSRILRKSVSENGRAASLFCLGYLSKNLSAMSLRKEMAIRISY